MKSTIARAYRNFEAFLVDHANNPLLRGLAIVVTLVDLRREATSVVWGRHDSRRGEARATLTGVRRDVHRIEKGLVMRPRRVPFGKDYVPGLVDAVGELRSTDAIPDADFSWAKDVLGAYFEATSEVTDDWLVSARRQYSAMAKSGDVPVLIPSPRSMSVRSSVTFRDLEDLAMQRRSVRWFEQSAVDPSAVDQALRIASQAPSACNRQNIRFHLVYGVVETSKVLGTVGGTRGFGDQVPAVAVLIGRLAGYRYGFDRHAIFIDGGLASMGFLLGLETLGLSSCCINWPDVGSRYAAIKKLIPLQKDEQILMLIAIGKADPDGMIPSSHKRALSELRTTSL